MNKIFNKIKENAKKLSLTEKEKESILSRVSLHIQENPRELPNIVSPYLVETNPVRETWYTNLSGLFALSIKQKKFMPIMIAILLILGGGTSFAANNSLPGDMLYPVKVNINENIKSLLAFNTEAKAKVQTDIASERLQEAEKLAVKGDISPEIKNTLEQNFNQHASEIKSLVANLEAKGQTNEAININSNFESTLNAHHLILSDLAQSDTKDQKNINDINTSVDNYLKNTVQVRSSEEEKVASTSNPNIKASAEGSFKDANKKISEVEKYINSQKDLNAEAKAQATAELNMAKDNVASGQNKLDNGTYSDAYMLFQKSLRAAKDTQALINYGKEIKLNINDSKNDSSKTTDHNYSNKDNTNSSNDLLQSKNDSIYPIGNSGLNINIGTNTNTESGVKKDN